MLAIIGLFMLVVVFVAITNGSSTPKHYQPPKPTYTSSAPVPEPEEEEEYQPAPPSVSAKEAIAMARAAENEEPWMDKMHRKYPVFPLGNGKYEVRAKGKDGHTYTCRCSESPDPHEYGLILMELQYKENIKDYV